MLCQYTYNLTGRCAALNRFFHIYSWRIRNVLIYDIFIYRIVIVLIFGVQYFIMNIYFCECFALHNLSIHLQCTLFMPLYALRNLKLLIQISGLSGLYYRLFSRTRLQLGLIDAYYTLIGFFFFFLISCSQYD